MALSAVALALFASQAVAAPGELDASFGVAGVVHTNIGIIDQPSALAVQSDHRIVAAGVVIVQTGQRFVFVARYLEDGSLDPGFGVAGIVVPNRTHQVLPRLAIQPADGKIVLATRGEASPGVFLYRFGPDGAPDQSFGTSGTSVLVPPSSIQIDDVAGVGLVAGGKILVAVRANASPGGTCVGLARFNPDGSPDLSFGTGGFVHVVASWPMLPLAFALQPDGRALVVGLAFLPGEPFADAFVARLLPDGSLDPSFNSTGVAVVPGAYGSDFGSVIPATDGSILVGGREFGSTPGESSWLLARFTNTGVLQPAFGSSGVVRYDPGPGSDQVLDMAESALGIAVTGHIASGALDLVVAMFDQAGGLQTSFGDGGFAGVPRLPRSGTSRLAVQPDGKFVVIGSLQILVPSFHQDLYLARYLGDATTPTVLAIESQSVTSTEVILTWHGAVGAEPIRVERARAAGEWTGVSALYPDGTGRVRFEDRAVEPGHRYGYRAVWWSGNARHYTSETWIDVPHWDLVASVRPNPARGGSATVSFTLPEDGPAQLVLVDAAGRTALALEVGGAGTHHLPLEGTIGPGLYWLRLRQGMRSVVERVVVVR